MGLPKGRTNNKAGRPKGKPNKVTNDLKTWVNDLVNDNRTQVIRDLKALEPNDRLRFFEKILSYVLPKMQQSDVNIDIDKLSDQQADMIVEEILKKIS